MKRLLLLFIFIITLGWGGNPYFNEYTGEIKYKKWAIIPALISIAIVMSGLLIATCVIWGVLLASGFILLSAIPICLLIIALSSVLVHKRYLDLNREFSEVKD